MAYALSLPALCVALALLAAGSHACSLPPRGCSAASCTIVGNGAYGKTPPIFNPTAKTCDKNIGWWYGFWNVASGNSSFAYSSQPGSPFLNFEPVRVSPGKSTVTFTFES